MTPTKISVVLPCFNAGSYIGEALSSVFAQSHAPYEVIVVDDGSTDDSVENAIRVGGSRIRVIRTDNHGPSHARNVGLASTSGDFVAFLDSDDRWRPEMLSRSLQILNSEPEAQAVFCNFVRFTGNGQYFPNDQFTYYPELASISTRKCRCDIGRVILGDAFTVLVGFRDIPSWPQATVYRRTAIDKLRFNEKVRACEAIDFFLQVTARGAIAFDSSANVEVRRHETNLTTDYKALVYAKLAAFERLRSCAFSEMQRQALVRRIVNATLDCTVAALRDHQRAQAIQFYMRACKAGRFGWQQLYFGLKLPFLVIRSMLSSAR